MDWLDFFKNLPLIVGLTFLLRYGFYLLRCKYYEKNPNEEKGDLFPHWKTNGKRFHAKRKKGFSNGYVIVKE